MFEVGFGNEDIVVIDALMAFCVVDGINLMS